MDQIMTGDILATWLKAIQLPGIASIEATQTNVFYVSFHFPLTNNQIAQAESLNLRLTRSVHSWRFRIEYTPPGEEED